MLVLDKKQGQSTYQGQNSGTRDDLQNKVASSASEINEPATPYQSEGDNINTNREGKDSYNPDEGSSGMGGGNEDDLPF